MLKKILIKGPALSRSGYGEMARFALRALRSRPDLYDIYIMNIPWGRTGHLSEDSEETEFINQTLIKTQLHVQNGGRFDISLQVTVPNEFERIAPVNIGYTAGIETTKVSPEWIDRCNNMVDRVITISQHAKQVFEQTTYDIKDQAGNTHEGWGLSVPVEVVDFPVRDFDLEALDINFRTEHNFLAVSQWGPRKNLENTVRWFVETFKDRSDVGLVLKTNSASDSIMDREFTKRRVEALLRPYENRACSVYLIHGEVAPGALAWLYEHDSMRALINIGHGEGYGLPMFEAAYHGLPLITTAWSGQMDFICKPNKKGRMIPRVNKVEYDLNFVQKEAVWEGVIQRDSKWAFPRENSYKRALKDGLERFDYWKREANALKGHIRENFTAEKMYSDFNNLVWNPSEGEIAAISASALEEAAMHAAVGGL